MFAISTEGCKISGFGDPVKGCCRDVFRLYMYGGSSIYGGRVKFDSRERYI